VIHPSLFGATVAWGRARKSHSHAQKKNNHCEKMLTEKTGSRQKVSGFLIMTVGVSKAASSAAGVSVNRVVHSGHHVVMFCSSRSSPSHVWSKRLDCSLTACKNLLALCFRHHEERCRSDVNHLSSPPSCMPRPSPLCWRDIIGLEVGGISVSKLSLRLVAVPGVLPPGVRVHWACAGLGVTLTKSSNLKLVLGV
jgi:hypothetical protein